jgi:hypothetical protein
MIDFSKADMLSTGILNEIAEHLMQDSVISIHIKNIKDYSIQLKEMIDAERQTHYMPELPTRTTSPKTSVRKPIESDSSKEDVLKLAYALSKYDYNIINSTFGTNLIQNEAFDLVAGLMGINKTSFRNYRDNFDRHVEQVYSNRKGWDVQLSPQLQNIKDLLDDKSETEIAKEVRDILETTTPDIDLLVRVSYGFVFGKKGGRTSFPFQYKGHEFNVINAPHENRVAYMVFTGFGNTLTNGIYPGIYVYREFNKIFTVFGESVTSPARRKWELVTNEFEMIEAGFTERELPTIKSYPYSYLTNRFFSSHDYNTDMDPYEKISLCQIIVNEIKQILDRYITQYC